MLKGEIIGNIEKILGKEAVITSKTELSVYESDGISIFKGLPSAVLLPKNSEEVSKVIKLCNDNDIKFIPRGAGTGLSGAATPEGREMLISLNRMNKILEIDLKNKIGVVEAGAINLQLSLAIANTGYYYAPDPSSQQACTIGGNIAHNSGGAHCLKYGVTGNHVLGLEVVLPNGEVIELGGKVLDQPGYDITGLFVGSEGTLGIVTKAIVKFTKKAEATKTLLATFNTIEDAANAVSDVIAEGIIPGAMEFMDKLAIEAVERSVHRAGFPRDVEALVLIDIDGLRDGVEVLSNKVIEIFKKNKAKEIKLPKDENERKRWWNGRKQAFGAMGTLSPNYLVEDGVITRSKLAKVLKKIDEIAKRYNLRVANVFHAGDGNLHPLIPFDMREEGILKRVIEAGEEILKVCVDEGGSITGEHGVGIIKRNLMSYCFKEEELEFMEKIRCVFNPKSLCNPNKKIPSRGCAMPLQTTTRTIVRGW
ncbi:MAG: FAD-linked oxidase C-terminal domain-containing protein [Nitrososphaerales archaeon]